MKVSIYISAEEIQVVAHKKARVLRYMNHPLPEGTMYNGTIMDGTLLAECLANLKKERPEVFKGGVCLVVDGSSILSRRIAVPKLRKKQYLQLVRDDFVDSIGDVDDLVCGYVRMESEQNAIFGCAVNKVLVDRYIAIFEEAGIRLNAIRVGVEILLNFAKANAALQKSTIVLNVLDGTTMLSMIFVEGENIIVSRTRLYGDEREVVHNSIIENLSGLMQFVQSQNHDEIAASYYLGASEADADELAALSPYDGIKIGTLPLTTGKIATTPPAAHFATLNTRFGAGGIDLLRARKELDAYIKSKKPKKTWIFAISAYALILAAISIALLLVINGQEREIGELRDYINAPHTVARRANLNELMQETDFYAGITRQIAAKALWEESMPAATSEMLDFILFGHRMHVNVRSFDFNENTGVVRVNAAAADARASVDYVNALYERGIAYRVLYQGFGSDAGGLFTFTIDITLNLAED